jgi:hypothetical protein
VADDGVPEPLQFVLNNGVRLMLIPTDGFGWVIGDREVAKRGSSECVLSLAAETETGVELPLGSVACLTRSQACCERFCLRPQRDHTHPYAHGG